MTDKPKSLTTLEAAFLEHLFGKAKGDVKQAMIMAGYSDNTPTTQVIRQLKDEIIAKGKDHLAALTAKAILGLDNVLDQPNTLGAKTKIAAVKEVLDRAGLVKPEGDFNLSVPEGGLIILPAKKKIAEEDTL